MVFYKNLVRGLFLGQGTLKRKLLDRFELVCEGGITLELKIGKAKLCLKRGDITKEETDAIVNAANSSLMGGGGVDGAIHRAGGPAILEACKEIVARIGYLPPGQAVITTGGNLKARYVIHTVGPIWQEGRKGEAEVLTSAYRESLQLAADHGLKSISFPSISTGAYRYPVAAAAEIALRTVCEFLQRESSLEEVSFVLFDEGTFASYAKALQAIKESLT